MKYSETRWAILSAIFTILLSIVIVYLLFGRFFLSFFLVPLGLFILLIFLVIWELLAKKKGFVRVTFLATLLILGIFAGGLCTGLFESVTLLEDSFIDLSNCAAILHIQNTGLTNVELSRIKIGDITCDTSSQRWLATLSRGAAKYLVIHYAHRRFQWWDEQSFYAYEDSYRASGAYQTDVEVAPFTFQNGSEYLVTLSTKGFLKHSFRLEAKHTMEENVSFQAHVVNVNRDGNYCVPDIHFEFNITSTSVCHIYYIKIGNYTLWFNPPQRITYWSYYSFAIHLSSSLWRYPPKGFETSGLPSEITSTPSITSSSFRVGETYNIIMRTMTNNNYTTTITMTQQNR